VTTTDSYFPETPGPGVSKREELAKCFLASLLVHLHASLVEIPYLEKKKLALEAIEWADALMAVLNEVK
jgi:hypothetical protein